MVPHEDVGLAQSFTTSTSPPAERAGLFQRAMAEAFSVGLSIQPAGTDPLVADVVGYRSRRLQLASLRFSAHTTKPVSFPTRCTRVLVTMQKEGEAVVAQGNREGRVGPGQMFLVDLSRPFLIETGAIRTTSIYLPLESVRSLVPQLDALTALPIAFDQGTASVFRAMIDELLAVSATLTEDAADRMADSIPRVLASVLQTLDQATSMVPSALRSAHKQRIRRFVLEHLSDPKLDVEGIADAVSLSSRYVHRLFADEDVTLMKWLWSERLERCRRELSEPRLRARSIGEIAYSWGFNDLAHFSRTFRERFGKSPRQLRRDAEVPQ